MKKLALELDDLQVESFATLDAEEVRGTIGGQNEPVYTETCDGAYTCSSCVDTCQNTCPASCWGTCDTCNTCEFHCTHFSICPPVD